MRAVNCARFEASFSAIASIWVWKSARRLGWISGRVITLVMMLPIFGVFGSEARRGISVLYRVSEGRK